GHEGACVQGGGAAGGSAGVDGVVLGPVRDGLSPPRRASLVTAGCEARGTSPRVLVLSGDYRQGEDRWAGAGGPARRRAPCPAGWANASELPMMPREGCPRRWDDPVGL